MTRRILCDKCGAEVTGNQRSELHLRWSELDEEGRLLDNGHYSQDLCKKCYKKALAAHKWIQDD